MPTARGSHAIGAANGLIYAVGGAAVNGGATNIVEVYDPAADAWEAKAPMSNTRQDFSGCGLNGKIYAIGGWRPINYTYSSIEEYDPVTDTWETKAPMPNARWGHATCAVDGKIYVFSGAKGWPVDIIYEATLVYDPVTNIWGTRASIPTPRWMSSYSVVDGKIYVIGGHSGSGVIPTLEVYDPVTDTWATKSPIPTSRWGSAAATANGNIYVFGGGESYPAPVTSIYKTVEEYNPVTDTWTTKSPMPVSRIMPAACSVNGKIYVPGGLIQANDPYAELFIYNPENELGIDDNINALSLQLHLNSPNPFNTSTSIGYELREPSIVFLSIYNHFGQHLETLVNTHQQQGKHQVTWDAEGLPPGIYFYRLQAGEQQATGKMVVMR